MAFRCAECDERTGTVYISDEGMDVCKTCYHAEIVSSYLRYMETRRAKDEACNQRAFDQCRELSAWLSLYRFGNKEIRKQAAAVINAWI